MGIKNLQAALIETGKIKIGIKGATITSAKGTEFRPPKKLDHFVLTTNERDAEGDFVPDVALMGRLKANGGVKDASGNLVGLPIRLLYSDPDLNFPTRYACFAGARCVCSGDGVEATTRDGQKRKCPCPKLDGDSDSGARCKPTGVLSCVIDGSDLLGGCHKFRTTSINTIKSILSSMHFIRQAAGGRLSFLPLRLIVQPRSTTTPAGAPTTVYIVSVVFPGGIAGLQEIALRDARENAQFLLSMRSLEDEARGTVEAKPEGEDEERDVAEEFYPESVSVSVVREQETTLPGSEDPGEAVAEGIPLPDDEAARVIEEEPVGPQAESHVPQDDSPDQAPATAPDPPAAPAASGITLEQKKRIADIKRSQFPDVSKDGWGETVASLSRTGKHSALDLTAAEANDLIRNLEDDIPF